MFTRAGAERVIDTGVSLLGFAAGGAKRVRQYWGTRDFQSKNDKKR